MAELRAFRREHGHCNVPRERSNRGLIAFIAKMRVQKRQNTLSAARLTELEELDFEWEPYAAEWVRYFARLVAFCQEHGHCEAPACDPALRSLNSWLVRQRGEHRKGKLIAERIRRLEELGVNWRTQDQHDLWGVRYGELVGFHRQHGPCRVPFSGGLKALAAWVERQRYRRDWLAPDRRLRLEALSFEWRNESPGVAPAAWPRKMSSQRDGPLSNRK
jgi:hypothetical protein